MNVSGIWEDDVVDCAAIRWGMLVLETVSRAF